MACSCRPGVAIFIHHPWPRQGGRPTIGCGHAPCHRLGGTQQSAMLVSGYLCWCGTSAAVSRRHSAYRGGRVCLPSQGRREDCSLNRHRRPRVVAFSADEWRIGGWRNRKSPSLPNVPPPSFRSAATAEPGDLCSEQRWRAILCRTVRTHSEVDFCTLSVRQSSAVDVLTLWGLRKRILLKTGTEVAYPVGADNPAGCPHGREVHRGIQQLIAGTASGAANRRRRRAMLRIVEDEPPDGVRPLGSVLVLMFIQISSSLRKSLDLAPGTASVSANVQSLLVLCFLGSA